MKLVINRKKYKGIGRPRKIDYYSERKSIRIYTNLIGQPIDPLFKVPTMDMFYVK